MYFFFPPPPSWGRSASFEQQPQPLKLQAVPGGPDSRRPAQDKTGYKAWSHPIVHSLFPALPPFWHSFSELFQAICKSVRGSESRTVVPVPARSLGSRWLEISYFPHSIRFPLPSACSGIYKTHSSFTGAHLNSFFFLLNASSTPTAERAMKQESLQGSASGFLPRLSS